MITAIRENDKAQFLTHMKRLDSANINEPNAVYFGNGSAQFDREPVFLYGSTTRR